MPRGLSPAVLDLSLSFHISCFAHLFRVVYLFHVALPLRIKTLRLTSSKARQPLAPLLILHLRASVSHSLSTVEPTSDFVCYRLVTRASSIFSSLLSCSRGAAFLPSPPLSSRSHGAPRYSYLDPCRARLRVRDLGGPLVFRRLLYLHHPIARSRVFRNVTLVLFPSSLVIELTWTPRLRYTLIYQIVPPTMPVDCN